MFYAFHGRPLAKIHAHHKSPSNRRLGPFKGLILVHYGYEDSCLTRDGMLRPQYILFEVRPVCREKVGNLVTRIQGVAQSRRRAFNALLIRIEERTN